MEAVDDGRIDQDDTGTLGIFAAGGEDAHAWAVHAGEGSRVGELVSGRITG
jgi:hypothetical protein